MEAECEGCWRTIRPEDTRYHCPTCDWVERCSACYAGTPKYTYLYTLILINICL
jgi:predicted RNA-binding Zn-ribbon protein involved in translation (DUF1610 family)